MQHCTRIHLKVCMLQERISRTTKMEKIIDFGTMCRICLSEKDCIDMTDEGSMIKTTKKSEDDVPLQNAFFYFSSLREYISEAPMLCASCANHLASAYDFAMKVSQSDERFVDMSMHTELFDESDSSKIIEYVDEVDLISNSEITHNKVDDGTSNIDELFDEYIVTVDNSDSDDNYVIKAPSTGLKRKRQEQNNYVAVPQYTVTSQQKDIDVASDIFSTKERTPPLNVKTIDVAACNVHITSDTFDLNASLQNYENDKDSMYLCKYCPKAFASSHHLIVHTKKSHVCQFCLQGFRLSTDLYDHIRTHKDFRCHICKKNFNSNSNLRSHLRKIHHLQLPSNVSLLTLAAEVSD